MSFEEWKEKEIQAKIANYVEVAHQHAEEYWRQESENAQNIIDSINRILDSSINVCPRSLLQNPAAHTAHTADKMHATAAMRKNQDVFAFSLFIAVIFA